MKNMDKKIIRRLRNISLLTISSLSAFGAFSCGDCSANSEIKYNYDSMKNSQVLSLDVARTLKATEDMPYYEFFKDTLKSAQNDYPSVFLVRNASQVFITSFMQLLTQLNLTKKGLDKYNDAIYLIDEKVFDYANTNNSRFNFDYLFNKFGDVFGKNKNLNLENGEIGILGNTKFVSSSNTPYSIFPRTLNELVRYLAPYLSQGVKLFDFYIPDISFVGMNDEVRSWIIKHANKITLLSDGNAQPYKFIRDNYIKWAKNQKDHYTKEQLLDYWNKHKASPGVQLDINYHFFYTLDEKIKIFNLNNSYIEPFNEELRNRGLDWAQLKIHQYPLNPNTINEYLNLPNNNIVEDYLKLNNLYQKSFLDFVIQGKEVYDPNKKNLIFMGSSLFRKNEKTGEWRFATQEYALDEIKSFFAKIEELYPVSEYNYFFKLHPVYNETESKEYINFLLGDLSNKAILLNSSIAWENMLTVDYEQIKNNKSILFTENGESKTHLYGIQGTTTVILSTITFLKEALKWNDEQVKNFVDIKNFPLSNTFDIVKRDIHYATPDEAKKANTKQMNSVYEFFVASGSFPAPKEWIDMREFLTRTK
ncbi:hypothetical protein VO56_00685 [Mycoplasmopsis gallinacea]|uniref:Lipoprotein n=1 Tax=Mycoplasmopsis gallinacea TaxID=29556 RepID=A0A0D5ZIM9_9BACT|nr:hypothetical protein VO56_00685 [Mycoplasmopsis gallinacea]